MLEELGVLEVLLVIEVHNFRTTITMDSYDSSLHRQILERSDATAKSLL